MRTSCTSCTYLRSAGHLLDEGASDKERSCSGACDGAGQKKVPAEGPGFRLMQVSRGSDIFVGPEEAQIGKRVRVRKDHRKAELRGRVGTIAQRWGNAATRPSTSCSTRASGSFSGTTSWSRSTTTIAFHVSKTEPQRGRSHEVCPRAVPPWSSVCFSELRQCELRRILIPRTLGE